MSIDKSNYWRLKTDETKTTFKDIREYKLLRNKSNHYCIRYWKLFREITSGPRRRALDLRIKNSQHGKVPLGLYGPQYTYYPMSTTDFGFKALFNSIYSMETERKKRPKRTLKVSLTWTIIREMHYAYKVILRLDTLILL